MLLDFAVNIIAGISLLILGYSFERIRLFYKARSIRHIWKPFIQSKKLSVVLSTRPGPYARSTPRLSLLEMLSFVNISNRLSSIGIEVSPKDSQVRIDDIKNENLVVLGGPLANEVAKEIWTRISPNIPFSLDTEKQSFQMTTQEYIPVLGADGKIIKDYGIIIRQPQPFNPHMTLFYCLGCHGFSTHGTTLYLTEYKYAKKLADAVGDKNSFVALIEFDVQNNNIAASKILHCFIIAHA